MILCDTDVFIELFEGNKKTYLKIKEIGIDNICISSISIMELFYGAINKPELSKLKNFLYQFEIIYLDNFISNRAVELIESYSKSHNLEIPDSLIASTALEHNCFLFTYNIKDFKFIKGLEIIK
jgi:tRNA(fMet)-specific endonuclease VapC